MGALVAITRKGHPVQWSASSSLTLDAFFDAARRPGDGGELGEAPVAQHTGGQVPVGAVGVQGSGRGVGRVGRSFVKNGSAGKVAAVDRDGGTVTVDFKAEGRMLLPARYLSTST
jgi:hypothetical protein